MVNQGFSKYLIVRVRLGLCLESEVTERSIRFRAEPWGYSNHTKRDTLRMVTSQNKQHLVLKRNLYQ